MAGSSGKRRFTSWRFVRQLCFETTNQETFAFFEAARAKDPICFCSNLSDWDGSQACRHDRQKQQVPNITQPIPLTCRKTSASDNSRVSHLTFFKFSIGFGYHESWHFGAGHRCRLQFLLGQKPTRGPFWNTNQVKVVRGGYQFQALRPAQNRQLIDLWGQFPCFGRWTAVGQCSLPSPPLPSPSGPLTLRGRGFGRRDREFDCKRGRCEEDQ